MAEGQVGLQKSLRVPYVGKNPRRTTVAICQPGEVIGWSALVPPNKYTLSAIAWQSGRVISVESATLRHALDRYPSMGFKVMKSLAYVMATRLRQTTGTLINEREAALVRVRESE